MRDLGKPQVVRLLDVWFIGPFLIYAAVVPRKFRPVERWTLGTLGVLTILYNARNYVRQQGHVSRTRAIATRAS